MTPERLAELRRDAESAMIGQAPRGWVSSATSTIISLIAEIERLHHRLARTSEGRAVALADAA